MTNMARNAEKAKSLLNKWVTMKDEFNKGGAIPFIWGTTLSPVLRCHWPRR